MKKYLLNIFLLLSTFVYSQEFNLNHNIGNNIVDQLYNFTCSGGGVNWARVFVLEDFGITGEFTITSGSFAIEDSNAAPGDGVIVNVYKVDENFPSSFDENDLIGSSLLIDIPAYTSHQIFTFTFPTPIILDEEVDKILVEVSLGAQAQNVFMGGTTLSDDFSWFRTLHPSCTGVQYIYQTTVDLNRDNLNYYITVTGDQVLNVSDQIKETISISPNPFKEKLILKFDEEFDTSSEILIYDINGKIVLNEKLSETIDVSDLTSGMYLIKIKTDGTFITKKLMKI